MSEKECECSIEAPVACNVCGVLFDLFDGNPCEKCKLVVCTNCLDEPYGVCEGCDYE